MKLSIRMPILVLICALLVFGLLYALFFLGMAWAVKTNYTDLKQEDDGFWYLVRDSGALRKKAAVCTCIYDPESGNDTINIPASYGDCPVTELGGYIGRGGPCHFDIEIKGKSFSSVTDPSSFDHHLIQEHLKLVYYDLVLNIGPEIRQIFAYQGGLMNNKELVVVRVYVNCDPGNPSFYSKDGILYQKNGKVVDGFLYWNQNYGTST